MLEMIAGVLVTTAMLALGAILFVFVCAMIGWLIYSTQNGGDDE
jgi:4-amino-4-deoxy-L-arabinose transferase-like glycosyltransferase